MSTTLGIYPTQILINAYNGAHVTTPLVFINSSDKTVDADISLVAIRTSSKNDGSVEFYTPKTTSNDMLSFLNSVRIELNGESGRSIKLYPKSSVKATLAFDVTTDQPADYYFSVVLSGKSNQEASKETLVSIQPAVSANILVSVNQKETAPVRITALTAPRFTLGGRQNFSLSVADAGKTYASVSGTVSVYDMFGKRLAVIPLRESVLLASDERNLSSLTNSSPTPQIQWDGGFLMGYYTVKTNLLVDKTAPITAETHFLAIPLAVIVASTIVFIIILGVILRVLRKLNLKEN